jgi:hypothetical protein
MTVALFFWFLANAHDKFWLVPVVSKRTVEKFQALGFMRSHTARVALLTVWSFGFALMWVL